MNYQTGYNITFITPIGYSITMQQIQFENNETVVSVLNQTDGLCMRCHRPATRISRMVERNGCEQTVHLTPYCGFHSYQQSRGSYGSTYPIARLENSQWVMIE